MKCTGVASTLFLGLTFSLFPIAPQAVAPPIEQKQTASQDLDSLRAAAEQGDAEAQIQLADEYFTSGAEGFNPAVSWREASRWYRRAAQQGHGKAQFSLGRMYEQGQGVPQDHVQAHKWLSLASAQASDEDLVPYARARDSVAEKMTPEQIAEAQRLAQQWKPTEQPSR